MFINNGAFALADDDANYDENDAVWQEEEKGVKDELDEYGFKAVEEEEGVEEKKKKEDKDGEEDEEDDDKKDGDVIEGFGLEKDV